MDALTQFLADCQKDTADDVARQVKLASVVGAMTREELLVTDRATVAAPEEGGDEALLAKLAFVASIGANARITPEMVKEAGIWDKALKPYLSRGFRALKSLATGTVGKQGKKVDRLTQLGQQGRKIRKAYRRGAAKESNKWLKPLDGIVNVYKKSPALGVTTGGLVLTGGAAAALKPKREINVYNS